MKTEILLALFNLPRLNIFSLNNYPPLVSSLKNVHIYKIYLFLFCKYRWVPACMYVYQVHDLLKEIRWYQIPWIWSNRQLCADISVLGNTPESAVREASVLNSWAIKGNLMYISPLWNFLLDLKANTRGAQTPLPRREKCHPFYVLLVRKHLTHQHFIC